jgi:hypothetical protein
VSRMTKRLATLDWTPFSSLAWAPAAVTLTYPDRWLELAPDGRTSKKHVRRFEKRFYRAWGFEPIWVWKMEFQRRGAPHFHLLMVTPKPGMRAGDWRRNSQVRIRAAVGDDMLFRQWVGVVWADVVGEPNPEERQKHINAGTRVDFKEGARCVDPRRAAVYFTKHASFADKWYQNVVPEEWQGPGDGPGRFWGYKGLDRATAVVTIEGEDSVQAKRIMRRWNRAQRTTLKIKRQPVLVDGKPVSVPVTRKRTVDRVNRKTGVIRTRKVNRRVSYLSNASGGGFLCVNDGPDFASRLVRAVEIARRPVDQGGCAPLPRRQKYLSNGNALSVELGGRFVDDATRVHDQETVDCSLPQLPVAGDQGVQRSSPPEQLSLDLGLWGCCVDRWRARAG